MRVVILLAAAWLLVAAVAISAAQSQTPAAFELASVRLWMPDSATPITQRITDRRFDYTNQTLRAALRFAFRVKDYLMVGPEWLEAVRVNIHATLPAGATPRQVPEMLQRLLVERFGLVTRREARTMDAYQLVVGKSGVTMREVEPLNELEKFFPRDPGLTSPAAIQSADTVADTPEGPVRTLMGFMGRITVTTRTRYTLTLQVERRTQTLDAARMSMPELAAVLADNMDRPVVDKTGLSGVYQFQVQLPLDASTVERVRAVAPPSMNRRERPNPGRLNALGCGWNDAAARSRCWSSRRSTAHP
jgi:uncharacterized protein (TIGR03435 family)